VSGLNPDTGYNGPEALCPSCSKWFKFPQPREEKTMPDMSERPKPPSPRAPGAQWKPIDSLADLKAVAENWFSNPTDLDWDEVRFVMDGIRRVTK